MSGTVLLLLPYVFMAWTGTVLPLLQREVLAEALPFGYSQPLSERRVHSDRQACEQCEHHEHVLAGGTFGLVCWVCLSVCVTTLSVTHTVYHMMIR
jgi:hypothetical protein